MMLFLLFLVSSAIADTGCVTSSALKQLRARNENPDIRSRAGICLVKSAIQQNEVAQTVLGIIRDNSEDLLLREDLMESIASAPLRQTVKVDDVKMPTVGAEERAAVERTMDGANGLIAITQAVKSMNDTVQTTKYEGEFIRSFSDIAINSQNHIVFRSMAIQALEGMARAAVDSGLYEEKLIRITYETIRSVSAQGEEISEATGANEALVRMDSHTQLASILKSPKEIRIPASGLPRVKH